ncbi:MAG TPA: DUF2141 domain-containing protein [Crocinitomix sp.]|nr:DUF2141 domain-containing protein [Crocinitomix sp.]
MLFSFTSTKEVTKHTLTVKVSDLRNSKGVVQFTLYNKEGSIPDEDYENYYRQLNAKITNKTSIIKFHNLPKGKYAINILHDENKNGIIEKGWIFPIEGIGFSNFNSIGFSNRPSFKKASFYLGKNFTKTVKIIYM